MSGIYLHIPFCKQACHYCDFHFSTSLKVKDEMINAMIREIHLQQNYFGEVKPVLNSIYFGGGTPSLLTSEDLLRLIEKINQHFSISSNAEITMEVNPDDVNPQSLMDWKQSGVNRLSIGIQSFFEEDLRWMNRAHNAVQADSSIKAAQDTGFNNLTIDLIYGFPLLSNNKWTENLQKAFKSGVEHLSCYALTVEPRTALAHSIINRQQTGTDEVQQAEHLEMLMNAADGYGFEQYEISNFATNGKYAVHNSAYWKGEKYLGIGPSAHSYDGISRQWNIRNNQQYIRALTDNRIPFEKEVLTEANRFNEYIMTSLRTKWGIDIGVMQKKFGVPITDNFKNEVMEFMKQGLLTADGTHYVLTKEGKFLADRIAAELFIGETNNQPSILP